MEWAYFYFLNPTGSGLKIAKTKECSKSVYIYVFRGQRGNDNPPNIRVIVLIDIQKKFEFHFEIKYYHQCFYVSERGFV